MRGTDERAVGIQRRWSPLGLVVRRYIRMGAWAGSWRVASTAVMMLSWTYVTFAADSLLPRYMFLLSLPEGSQCCSVMVISFQLSGIVLRLDRWPIWPMRWWREAGSGACGKISSDTERDDRSHLLTFSFPGTLPRSMSTSKERNNCAQTCFSVEEVTKSGSLKMVPKSNGSKGGVCHSFAKT